MQHVSVNVEYIVHKTGLIGDPLSIDAPLIEEVERIVTAVTSATEIRVARSALAGTRAFFVPAAEATIALFLKALGGLFRR